MKNEKTTLVCNGEKNVRILAVKSAWFYALGILGLQLFIGYVNSYQSQFYTSMFGADLMVVAVIILVSKVISAIADPFIGNIIDRSKFKSGKMRPFILLSSFPIAAITTLMFIAIPFKSMTGMYIYITITTLLWNISMSFADIPSQGMLALLSPRPEERNMAAGIANILKSIALAAPGVIVPVICVFTKSEGGAIGRLEYLISALLICVIGFPLYLLIFIKNREAVLTAPSPMSLKEMLKELKNNKMLMIVFLTFMLGFGRNMAMGIGVQAGATLAKDGITLPFIGFMAGENLTWLLGLTAAVTAMVSIIFIPAINQKWGEKKTFIVFAIYGGLVCTASFLLYALSDSDSFLRTIWGILIYQIFVGFAFGPNGYLPMVMTSDIVDYTEWKTGKRNEGTQFAVLSLSNKISNALSVAVGIFIVGASGYNAAGVKAGTLTITPTMQTIVFAAFLFIPGLCMLLSMIPMFFYKIDGKVKEEMHLALELKRKEAKEG